MIISDITPDHGHGEGWPAPALASVPDTWSTAALAAGVGLVLLTGDGWITAANAEAERLLGRPGAELRGQRLTDLIDGVPDDIVSRSTHDAAIRPLVRARTRLPEAMATPVQLSVAALDSEPAGSLVVSLTDISECARVETALRESETHYRTLLDNANDIVYTHDLQGNITSANLVAETTSGYSRDELLRMNIGALIAPEDFAVATGHMANKLAGRATTVYQINIVAKDDRRIPVEVNSRVIYLDGRPVAIQGIARDITDRRAAEAAERANEERFRVLVQNGSDAILILDATGMMRYVSPSVERIVGYPPSALVGLHPMRWIHPDDRARTAEVLARAVAGGGVTERLELRFRHIDGSWRDLEALLTDLLHNPVVGGVVINARDVTDRKHLEEQLTRQAFFDPLTGLPNRTLLVDGLVRALAAPLRTDGVAVLFIDLDGFKVVNDSLGHAAGDLLLAAVARRFAGSVPHGGTVARLGGDEFAVVLEHVSGPEGARAVAAAILDQLKEPVPLEGREMWVGASIGIALCAAGEQITPDELLRRADIAMYRAKAAGKGRAVVFDPEMNARARERLDLETEMRRAIDQREFELVYQPEVDLRRGNVVGVEALLRWPHAGRGEVLPAEFIPVAEEAGLIMPLGMWALEEACRQARRWEEGWPALDLSVSVNLSPVQFRHADFVGQVARILHSTRLSPSRLRLEITETSVMDDADTAIRVLGGLKALGVRLVVDDFGTGYSSLSYLRRFPLDALKIDRSFVTAFGHDRATVAIVRAITTLAHALGMEVTAEGIETAEELDGLRECGADHGQGYFFSPAVSAAAVGLMVRGEGRGRPAA